MEKTKDISDSFNLSSFFQIPGKEKEYWLTTEGEVTPDENKVAQKIPQYKIAKSEEDFEYILKREFETFSNEKLDFGREDELFLARRVIRKVEIFMEQYDKVRKVESHINTNLLLSANRFINWLKEGRQNKIASITEGKHDTALEHISSRIFELKKILSPLEIATIKGINDGKTYKEIAKENGKSSDSTIDKVVAKLIEKMRTVGLVIDKGLKPKEIIKKYASYTN